LKEQRRITSQVEALTEKSRRAKEALDAIPPLLERFRQSVLASAFRGDLTAGWRAKNPDVEPADKLLQRIRTERRRRWEESELAKLQAKGKPPGDDRWKQKYKDPESVDTERLPDLPHGWAWASVDELSMDIVDCPHSTPVYGSGDHFAVDTTCIVPGAVVLNKLRRVDLDTYQLRTRRLVPQAGDVVFAREGTVGTAASLPATPNMCLGQRVMLMRPSLKLESRWIEQALMCHLVTSQYAKKLVGSTVAHLNVSDVVRLAIPVPPKAEQSAIFGVALATVRRIESMASIAKGIQLEQSLLDRSILAKAFRGELVPQDPSDEPASVLLDRIRAERATAAAAKEKKPAKRR
jgi:type I restriction enzyme S subunit